METGAGLTRLDRYILRHLIASLGFFTLVFTGVVWLTQAVRLIDTVVASGQSARVFLEFWILVLPQVFVIVLPLAGIGAALHALNSLYSDSELTVMMSAGLGPLALLRPVAIFGALVAVAMLVTPPGWCRSAGASSPSAARRSAGPGERAIVERQFLHPMQGLTLFITDTSRAGEMAGIFLDDQREPEQPVHVFRPARAAARARGWRRAW